MHATVKKKLLLMRKQLLESIEKKDKQARYTLQKEIGDLYDQTQEDKDKELSYTLNDKDRETLKLIEDSLTRIDLGTYGICEECNNKIKKERLEAVPFAKLCVACKTLDEERSKGTSPSDEKLEF